MKEQLRGILFISFVIVSVRNCVRWGYYLLFWMNCVADLLWPSRSSIGSFVERDFLLWIATHGWTWKAINGDFKSLHVTWNIISLFLVLTLYLLQHVWNVWKITNYEECLFYNYSLHYEYRNNDKSLLWIIRSKNLTYS